MRKGINVGWGRERKDLRGRDTGELHQRPGVDSQLTLPDLTL